MRLPDILAPWRWFKQLLIDFLETMEANAQANKRFWEAHTGTIWAMGITVALLWCIVLFVSYVIL